MIMKKIFRIYLLPALVMLTVSSCKKSFEDLTKNPNVPKPFPHHYLFNGVLNNMVDLPDGAYASSDQNTYVIRMHQTKMRYGASIISTIITIMVIIPMISTRR